MKQSRIILRGILTLWTILTMFLFVLDFLSGNKYDSAASSIGIIYLGLLGIYVSSKEYNRWKTRFITKYLGEIYVVVWTVLMIFFVAAAPISQGKFIIPSECAVIYTSVIGIYAVSVQSKVMHKRLEKK